MRKIYFIIFGVALVILILLVDWREKYYALTGKKSRPETLLDHLQPAASEETGLQPDPEDSSLAAALFLDFKTFPSNPTWTKAGNCCGKWCAITSASFHQNRKPRAPIASHDHAGFETVVAGLKKKLVPDRQIYYTEPFRIFL
jgi:hypothetical protein